MRFLSMLKISPPSDTRSRVSLPADLRWRRLRPSPRIQRFAARRISPLRRARSASRHPFPIPAIFRWRREASPRIQKIRRQANLPAWAVPVPPPAIPSPFPPNLPLPAPFVGGAKRRRVSKRFAVRRISPLWLGRIVKEGAGPLLDTPAPLPRPAFPATLIHPRGRVSGGGLPSRLPIVPGGFCRRARGDFRISTGTPSPALFAPARTIRSSTPGTAEIASF